MIIPTLVGAADTLWPAGIFATLVLLVVGRLLGRGIDARRLIVPGLLVMAAANYWMAIANLYISPWQATRPRVVTVIGLSPTFAPLNVAAFLYIPKQLRGSAVGLLALLRNEGGNFGISMVQTLEERRDQFHTARPGEFLDPLNLDLSSYLEQVGAFFYQRTGDPARSQQMALKALANLRQQQAASFAYFDIFWATAVVSLGAAFLVFLMKRSAAGPPPSRRRKTWKAKGVRMARLLSVNAGRPREIAWRGKTVYTSVWKEPVEGRRLVRRLNVDGDAQGDLAGHGGEHRAVFVYQMDSYRYWQRELKRSDFTFGQFGENFTVEGLADSEVCIGDRYRIGSALFEVTQPRVTCYRVGIRMDEPRMAALLVAHHRPGFYLRVLEEGEVGAGDDIVQVAEGPERLSVAAADALLYLPGAARQELEKALRVPALSPGWKSSFDAILRQLAQPGPRPGNAGLLSADATATAAPGFRPLKVVRLDRESGDVVSVVLEPADGRPLTIPLPGQFVVLRIRPKADGPAVLRCYSLSDMPESGHYRISVKREPKGVASTYVTTRLRTGDVLDVSAPRGAFVLGPGNLPVVLLSAGVGVTPVMAMLHVLAAEAAPRPLWWIHGARNRLAHTFAKEVRDLLAELPGAKSHVRYSRPDTTDRPGIDFDAAGRLSVAVLEKLGVPREADYYICGPAAFLDEFTAGLVARGVARDRVHTEIFGSGKPVTPGMKEAPGRMPHAPAGPPGTGPRISFARAGITVPWDPKFQSLLECAEACDVPVRWSCRTGVCHTCECGLISGEVNYDPEPLEPPAAGNLLICCSRPREDLVIDI